jgi:hypothetical protein
VLIDRYLPDFDVHERHHALVDAPAEESYAAVRRLDLWRSATVRRLLALRGVPTMIRRRERAKRTSLTLDDLARSGFVILEEEPGTEIVLGLVGRFWTAKGSIRRVEPADFAAYAEPGLAKAVWNFRVEPISDDRSVVITETRVRCTDDDSRRRFVLYWAVMGPFSATIRRRALSLIRDDAEGRRGPPGYHSREGRPSP